MNHILRLTSKSPEQTRLIGETLGGKALPGDVFLLKGPLGSGKTCFTQGLAVGLEVQRNVRSPTFVLATRYHGRHIIHHIDLFRIDEPLDFSGLGLEEYLDGDDICVVEWADKAVRFFPTNSIWVEFNYGDATNERSIKFEGNDNRARALIDTLLTPRQ